MTGSTLAPRPDPQVFPDRGDHRQALSRDECLRRLGSGTVARVAVTAGALPRIEVVRYYLIGEMVFVDLGSAALARGLIGHVVAFESGTAESDRQDDAWSVCAVGVVAPMSEEPFDESIVEMHPQLLSGWVRNLSRTASRISEASRD